MQDTGIGVIHGTEWGSNFGISLLQLVTAELGGRLIEDGFFFRFSGSGNLIEARTRVARAFLDSNAEWMIGLDSDVGYGPDLLRWLHKTAEMAEARFVTGVYVVNQEQTADSFGGFIVEPGPAVYLYGDDGFEPYRDILGSPVRIHEVDACGAGCSLIHRSVFEAVAKEYDGDVWYDPIDGVRAEDLAFCIRVRRCGIPIYADAWYPLNHLKSIWYQSGRPNRPVTPVS